MQVVMARWFVSARRTATPIGSRIVVVVALRILPAWFACLMLLGISGVSGCALHRGSVTSGGAFPNPCGTDEVRISKSCRDAGKCVTPCPRWRCRLYGVRCRIQGLVGDVGWLIREGIVGGPEQDIPPGPTPPPILDELFPLPTRPVFYPNPTPPRSDNADASRMPDEIEYGQNAPLAPGSERSGDNSPGRGGVEKRQDGALPSRSGPEVIPTPAPLPPGDSWDSSDRGVPGKAEDTARVWDSAGWRPADDAVVKGAPRVGQAPPEASSQSRTGDGSGSPAWVFLPAAPIVGDGPRVTVSSDHSGDQGRRQAGVRR